MERLVKTALRPAAALLFAGVVAALAAFTLLAAPPGSITEAQDSGVEVMATSTKVVIDVTGATVTNNNFVSFYIPGYTSTGPRDGADTVYQTCHFEAVALDGDGNPGASVIAPGTTAWHCRAGASVFGFFQANAALSNFRMTVTDVEFDSTVGDESAAAQFTSGQSATRSTTTSLLTGSTSPIIAGASSSNYDFRRPGRLGGFEDVSSVSPNAAVQVQVRVESIPIDMPGGSSIVIYLEDDYSVPSSINRRSVWFTFTGVAVPGKTVVSQPGRHYPTDDIDLDTDDYFGGDDDHSIRVYIPDLYQGSAAAASGFQGAVEGQTLTLTISKNAGIRNPSEAGDYEISYAILGPDGSVPSSPDNDLDLLRTEARIGLSDDSDVRGKTVTATGSGFKNGVTATLYMKHYATAGRHPGGDSPTAFASSGDPNAARRGDSATGSIMTPAETCADIIDTGTELGDGLVGSDDRVEIEFTIANPPFQSGSGNLLCMSDGEGTASSTDVEHINLEPSIQVAPDTVTAGQLVTVNGLDFPARASFGWVKVSGQRITTASGVAIGTNGKGTINFAMPGNIRDTVQVEACWGGANADDCDANGDKADVTINVFPSALSLSKEEARPNESIILRGANFSRLTGDGNDIESITIDDAPVLLASDDSFADIEVSNAGQFSTTIILWSEADNNPVLTAGKHRIKVTDKGGYTGVADIVITEPTISVSPELVGPREYAVISGANWPVSNDDGANLSDINVRISGGGIETDTENVETNSNGSWTFRYRVPRDVAIPATLNVRATYGTGQDFSKSGVISVPSADLSIEPNRVPAGAEVVLNGTGFAPFVSNIEVKIGSNTVAVPIGATTNREGNLEDLTVRVPSLDDGVYTVQLKVGGAAGTVSIGELTVLEDTRGETDLIEGLSPMGDNLVRVFHYNSAIKFWTFYDPRPDFLGLNTQLTLATGRAYWILIDEDQEVTLNGRARTLTCYTREDGRRDCWNEIVW